MSRKPSGSNGANAEEVDDSDSEAEVQVFSSPDDQPPLNERICTFRETGKAYDNQHWYAPFVVTECLQLSHLCEHFAEIFCVFRSQFTPFRVLIRIAVLSTT